MFLPVITLNDPCCLTTSCISRFSVYDQTPWPRHRIEDFMLVYSSRGVEPRMAGKHGSRLQAWRQEREMAVPIFKGKHKAVWTNLKRCENFNLISPLRQCACSRKGAPPTVLQTMVSAWRSIFKYLRPWRTFLIQTSASIDFCFALSLFFF